MKNKLIWMILSLLGFATACEKLEQAADEYGVPYATYSVKGKVINQQGEPIPGIQVNLEHAWYLIQTDANGDFAYDKVETFPREQTRLKFTDIDGPENGSYQEEIVSITFVENKDFEGGGWHMRDYIVTDPIEVVMRETSPETPEESPEEELNE